MIAIRGHLMQDLMQLVYISRASSAPSPQTFESILASSLARNNRDGITGVLAYSAGSYLQLIEGPVDKVRALLAVICRDPRHHQVRVLLERRAERRAAPAWSMGVLNLLPSPPADLGELLEGHILACNAAESDTEAEEAILALACAFEAVPHQRSPEAIAAD
jgi:hypothetical protein